MTGKRRALIYLGLSVGMGTAVGAMAFQWLNQVEEGVRNEVNAEVRLQPALVATRDLSPGTQLTEDTIRVVKFPKDALPEGVFDGATSATGRILLAGFQRNELIVESKLAPAAVTTPGIAALTHEHTRAIAVQVEEAVAAAQLIQPGDRVDVLVTIRANDKRRSSVTKVVLENVLVLAVAGATSKSAKPAESGSAAPSNVMTLEVTPDDAEKLALAASEGHVQLVVRHPLNHASVETKGATVQSLLESYGGFAQASTRDEADRPQGPAEERMVRSPRPEREPVTPRETPADPALGADKAVRVEVFRGNARSEIKF